LVGASTGGTEALRVLLQSLPSRIPPVLVVQHIPPVFSKALAERLNDLCPFEVKEAQDGDLIKENQVLIAPGNCHIEIKSHGSHLSVRLSQDSPRNGHRPSVDVLFHSALSIDTKKTKIIAVLLTGMGKDGAEEMLALKKKGITTIAQDESTSVIFGMPKEAIRLGGVTYVERLDKIGARLVSLLNDSLQNAS
jgi:two-component system chemotaxis response regulator CheB